MQYYGQLSIDRIIHQKYFFKKEKGTYVECGAFDGIMESNTLALYKYKNWNGFNIEALPNIFKSLEINRKNDVNLNFALSDKDGISNFKQAIDKNFRHYDGHFGNGSLQHTDNHMKHLLERGCSFINYEVKTLSLPSLFQNYIKSKVDFFVLDVEGHEAIVLSKLNLVDPKYHPSVWCIEYGHAGYENIISVMKNNDYKLDYQDSINLVFIKKGGEYDKNL